MTTAMLARIWSGSRSRRSMPSRRMVPLVGSCSRSRSLGGVGGRGQLPEVAQRAGELGEVDQEHQQPTQGDVVLRRADRGEYAGDPRLAFYGAVAHQGIARSL